MDVYISIEDFHEATKRQTQKKHFLENRPRGVMVYGDGQR